MHDQKHPDILFAAIALLPRVALADDDVDLLLVLAADVSRSIDSTKFQLQREGYAAAISDPRVLDAIRSGRTGRIGLMFVEWSGVGAQRVVIDWTTVGDSDSAKGFGDRLLEAPRSFADRTSISGARIFDPSLIAPRTNPPGTPSISPATAPIMPAAMSRFSATTLLQRGLPSTGSSF